MEIRQVIVILVATALLALGLFPLFFSKPQHLRTAQILLVVAAVLAALQVFF